MSNHKYIDTHAHIYNDEFSKDRDDMLRVAFEKGVDRIYMPNVDHTSIDGMLELEHKYPGQCFPMMGLHPCNVKKDFHRELYLVEDWLKNKKFTAVGEIGMDLYWDTTFRPQQEEAFKIQVDLAKKHKLPIVIHCRSSMKETLDLLEPLMEKGLTGIFHCFSGDLEDAKKIIDFGFFLGIGGVVTFKNGGLDKILPEVDLKHIVLETDAPYLAPVPFRGKRNDPGLLPLIAVKIAEIKKTGLEDVVTATTANALALFKG
jgi:TatD DNase family protein